MSPLPRLPHFELKQVGFTATYRPRQCLLTSRKRFYILRAGLLEPHRSESCTWHNRDFIDTMHVLTQRPVRKCQDALENTTCVYCHCLARYYERTCCTCRPNILEATTSVAGLGSNSSLTSCTRNSVFIAADPQIFAALCPMYRYVKNMLHCGSYTICICRSFSQTSLQVVLLVLSGSGTDGLSSYSSLRTRENDRKRARAHSALYGACFWRCDLSCCKSMCMMPLLRLGPPTSPSTPNPTLYIQNELIYCLNKCD
jgi:hypothetical protein